MIAALPLSVSAAGEYVPGNPRWSGYQNQVQWDRPAGAASGDSFEYEAQLLLGDDVVESKAVEIDTYLFFTNDVVTRPQEEYTIRVRARWIMIVGDPDGQYMVADVGEWGPWATKAGSGGGEAEPPHEHSYTQKHDAAQHWQACSCGERLNVANHMLYPKLGEKARNNGHVVYSLDFEVTPHMLRHTYITNLIHASVDPKTVQYLAGHESSKITMDIYAKVKYNKPEQLAGVLSGAFAEWDGGEYEAAQS